jgi:hypothetical protein
LANPAVGGYSNYPSQLFFSITAYESSANPATNSSQVRLVATVYITGGYASSSGGSFLLSNGGSGSIPAVNWSGANSLVVYDQTFGVAHNADGTGSYAFDGLSSMNGWGSTTAANGYIQLTDFSRPPLAPASCTTSIVSRNVTVTSGVADVTNRPAIIRYEVEATTPNETAWSGNVYTMDGSRQYLYSNLDGGKTYRFRTRAVNSEGAGAWTESASTFVPAGGRRWDGSAWTPTTIARRWNGSAWVDLTIAKRWNGSAWVDLT